MPVSSEGPTVRLRRLGMELRVLREASGLNSQQAAEELGCSQSKISRLENGKSPVSVRDVRASVRFRSWAPVECLALTSVGFAQRTPLEI